MKILFSIGGLSSCFIFLFCLAAFILLIIYIKLRKSNKSLIQNNLLNNVQIDSQNNKKPLNTIHLEIIDYLKQGDLESAMELLSTWNKYETERINSLSKRLEIINRKGIMLLKYIKTNQNQFVTVLRLLQDISVILQKIRILYKCFNKIKL